MNPHLLHNMSMSPRTSIRWEIQPIESSIVRFNLWCIEKRLNKTLGVKKKEQLWSRSNQFIIQKLETAWKGYGLKGAALIYPSRIPAGNDFRIEPAGSEEAENARLRRRIRSQVATNLKKDFAKLGVSLSDLEWRVGTPISGWLPSHVESLEELRHDIQAGLTDARKLKEQTKVLGPALYRATDVRLVLNVLARTRGQVLMAGATLRLEEPFLERYLATDDPRIVALARSSGVRKERK